LKVRKSIPTFAILFYIIVWQPAIGAERIIISYSSRAYAFLPAQVAVAKSFFKDENLDPVLVQMRSQVTIPALISGEVNHTLSFGNILAGAMQGTCTISSPGRKLKASPARKKTWS
jgi:hypothetical protein